MREKRSTRNGAKGLETLDEVQWQYIGRWMDRWWSLVKKCRNSWKFCSIFNKIFQFLNKIMQKPPLKSTTCSILFQFLKIFFTFFLFSLASTSHTVRATKAKVKVFCGHHTLERTKEFSMLIIFCVSEELIRLFWLLLDVIIIANLRGGDRWKGKSTVNWVRSEAPN